MTISSEEEFWKAVHELDGYVDSLGETQEFSPRMLELCDSIEAYETLTLGPRDDDGEEN